jgi:ABC-type lipoprotein release transport system permease subunit
MSHAVRLVLGGVAVGLAAAAVLSACSAPWCTRRTHSIPWQSAARRQVLTLVATLASYVPARRGTRMAPVETLRGE